MGVPVNGGWEGDESLGKESTKRRAFLIWDKT
jgi:hypothetical protein